VSYRLHPDAALEHEQQVAFYEDCRAGLGARYHAAMLRAIATASRSRGQFRIVRPPDIYKVRLQGFPLTLVCRTIDGEVQVPAVAHHRRAPNYWARRTL